MMVYRTILLARSRFVMRVMMVSASFVNAFVSFTLFLLERRLSRCPANWSSTAMPTASVSATSFCDSCSCSEALCIHRKDT